MIEPDLPGHEREKPKLDSADKPIKVPHITEYKNHSMKGTVYVKLTISTSHFPSISGMTKYYKGLCNNSIYVALHVPIERIIDTRDEEVITSMNELHRMSTNVSGPRVHYLPVVVNEAWYNKHYTILSKLFVLEPITAEAGHKVLHVDVRVFCGSNQAERLLQDYFGRKHDEVDASLSYHHNFKRNFVRGGLTEVSGRLPRAATGGPSDDTIDVETFSNGLNHPDPADDDLVFTVDREMLGTACELKDLRPGANINDVLLRTRPAKEREVIKELYRPTQKIEGHPFTELHTVYSADPDRIDRSDDFTQIHFRRVSAELSRLFGNKDAGDNDKDKDKADGDGDAATHVSKGAAQEDTLVRGFVKQVEELIQLSLFEDEGAADQIAMAGSFYKHWPGRVINERLRETNVCALAAMNAATGQVTLANMGVAAGIVSWMRK